MAHRDNPDGQWWDTKKLKLRESDQTKWRPLSSQKIPGYLDALCTSVVEEEVKDFSKMFAGFRCREWEDELIEAAPPGSAASSSADAQSPKVEDGEGTSETGTILGSQNDEYDQDNTGFITPTGYVQNTPGVEIVFRRDVLPGSNPLHREELNDYLPIDGHKPLPRQGMEKWKEEIECIRDNTHREDHHRDYKYNFLVLVYSTKGVFSPALHLIAKYALGYKNADKHYLNS